MGQKYKHWQYACLHFSKKKAYQNLKYKSFKHEMQSKPTLILPYFKLHSPYP